VGSGLPLTVKSFHGRSGDILIAAYGQHGPLGPVLHRRGNGQDRRAASLPDRSKKKLGRRPSRP
jgi:hypothetical protein